MTSRVIVPGPDASVDNHERRIRALERSPGGGGIPSGNLEALWWGLTPPLAVGLQGGIWTVPYIGGVSVTWTISRAKFRLETPATAGSYTVKIQRSAPGGPFTGTDIVSLVLAAGAHEDVVTGGFGVASVSSGDLLGIDWTVLGSAGAIFTIQLEASS